MADGSERWVTSTAGMSSESLASTVSQHPLPIDIDKTVEERIEPIFGKMSDELLYRIAHSQNDVVAFEGRPKDASNEHIQALAKLHIEKRSSRDIERRERRSRRRDRLFSAVIGVAIGVATTLLASVLG